VINGDQLRLVDKLSPSKIDLIRRCKLRFIYGSINSKRSVKAFNKYSFLGTLMHAVLDDFIKTRYSLEDFEQKWDQVLTRLLISYEIAEDIETIKYHLPYYYVKKKKLKNYFEFLLPMLNSNTESEIEIKSTLISGLADIVIKNEEPKKITIIDFKSGPIRNIIDGTLAKIDESYKLQLLSYGLAFYLDGYEALDIECNLHSLSQDDMASFIFSIEDYVKHEEFLLKLKEDINRSIQNKAIEALANPIDSNCIYCEFVTSCNRLHETLLDGEVRFSSMVLVNEINCEFDDQNSRVNITTNGGIRSVHRIPDNTFLEIREIVNSGKMFLLTNLYQVLESNIQYWTKYTKTYIIIKS
jgi:hypothetical protein